ncbi:MAG: hypothetical protein IKK83_06155 [Clostridia bacterium]|nr:hypothetical protein [Clostridia bacterium]
MKKMFMILLFLTLSATMLCACGGDDGASSAVSVPEESVRDYTGYDEATGETIVGSWKGSDGMGGELIYTFDADGKGKATMPIKVTDNKGNVTETNFTYNTNWSISNGTLTVILQHGYTSQEVSFDPCLIKDGNTLLIRTNNTDFILSKVEEA